MGARVDQLLSKETYTYLELPLLYVAARVEHLLSKEASYNLELPLL